MIAAHSLSKKFGRFLAVDSVDFTIGQNQVVGFLGPNGAGKTTTIRMIAGYLPPTSGNIEVDGLDVSLRRQAVQQRIGYLPESAPLYTDMRVNEFLRFRARLYRIPLRRRRAAIDLALQRCWLGDVRRRPINQLSKGYRQRVGLAAAILHQPPVLILDEPTVGLDPSQIREVRGLIRELATAHTVLLSTHILPEVEQSCDRIIMIARGRIRAQGTINDLRSAAAGRARFVVEVDTPKAEQALRELGFAAGIESTPIDARWRRLTVTAKKDADDLRESIAAALSRVTCTVRELRREAPTLEHLFIQMAANAEAGEVASKLAAIKGASA
jgi:ABC-2 type transport system ATP-binding protein